MSHTKTLLLVLVGLLLGGGYNYHRNFEAEAAIPRPYRGYSADDLETLLDAYEGENAALERRYSSSRAAGRTGGSGGLLDENIRAFEQAQRASSGSRSLGAQLSMQQSATREIEEELARRQGGGAMQVHLRRLLTL